MANEFNSVLKKRAFVQTEADSILCENNTDAFEIKKEKFLRAAIEDDVVDNCLTVDDDAVRSKVYLVEGDNEERDVVQGAEILKLIKEKLVPFGAKDHHNASVKRWCVHRPEWHHVITIFLVVGGEETQLFSVLFLDGNLMIPLSGVDRDEVQMTASAVNEVDGIVATGHGVCERLRDGVERAIGYAHAPNK
jgi:hypothetical protein